MQTKPTKPYKIEKEWLNHAVFSPYPLKREKSKCIYKGYKRDKYISNEFYASKMS